MDEMLTATNHTVVSLGKPFLVPVSPPIRFEGGENCGFLGRAIFDQFQSSTAPALRFLAVSHFFGTRPPISATSS